MSSTTAAFLHGLSSATHKEVKKESHSASSFFLPSATSSYSGLPLVLHLKPPGWYCCRFPLICPPPAVFLLRPLLLVVLPSGLRYTAHLGVGRMVGALNLLMQPFVAIASELAAPLPGSTDRCSRTLPQLPAIGYLLLLMFSVSACVCVCIHYICFPNKGNTQIYEQIHHMHHAHTSTVTQVQVHTYTNTQRTMESCHSFSHIRIIQTHLSNLSPST